MKKLLQITLLVLMTACGSGSKGASAERADLSENPGNGEQKVLPVFNADSAWTYVEKQVNFGPRVPNTKSHREAGDWLSSELRRHGAKVTEQRMELTAFDGTRLDSRNIFGQYNSEESSRLLLLAHWDCRPWADQDPDESKRSLPVEGANDGASGVGVLLEIARLLSENSPSRGIDILFVDAEDWGTEGNDDSWALGTRYFAENPPVEGYVADEAILLDMVGGKDALFCKEYFSERSAPGLSAALWKAAEEAGHGEYFRDVVGTAVNDDHIELIKVGIPAVDIIEYHPETHKFNERWHTSSDNMEGLSKETLKAVGETMVRYIYSL